MKLFRDNVYDNIARATAPESDIERFVRSVYHDEELQRALNEYAQRNSLLEKEDPIIYRRGGSYVDEYLHRCSSYDKGWHMIEEPRPCRRSLELKISVSPEKRGNSIIFVYFHSYIDVGYKCYTSYSFVEEQDKILLKPEESQNLDNFNSGFRNLAIQSFSRLTGSYLDCQECLSKEEYNGYLIDRIPLKVLMSGLEKAIRKLI